MSNRNFKTAEWWSFLLRYAILTILGGTLASGAQDQLLLKHHGGNYLADTRSPVNLDSSISWNEKIYYSGQSSIFGTEPWVSDGSDSGTKMIGDIAPLAKNSDPRNFTSSQDYLFFIANNDRGRPTLCRIDRNDQLKVMHEFTTHSRVLQTRTLGHKFFVSLKDDNYSMYNSLASLYVYDSLTNKVEFIGSYRITSAHVPQIWTVFGNSLYLANGYAFRGYYSSTIERPKIWKTSGVAGDLAEFQGVSLEAATDGETWNGNYHYIAGMENGKNALWRLNQNSGNPELVMEFPSTVASIYPRPLSFNSGALYFAAGNSTSVRSLWRSDGTVQGTIAVDPKVIVNSQDYIEKINGHLFYLQRGAQTNVNQLMRIEDDQEINIVSIIPEAAYIDQWNDKPLVISSTTGKFPSYNNVVTFYQNDGSTDTNSPLLTYTIEKTGTSGIFTVPIIKTSNHLFYGRRNPQQRFYSYYFYSKTSSVDQPFLARGHLPIESVSFDQAREELGKAKSRDEKIEIPWDDPLTTKFRDMIVTKKKNYLYLVNRKNVYFFTNAYINEDDIIQGVKVYQDCLYILVYQPKNLNSYRIFRWRSNENASDYNLSGFPKIYKHRSGLIFAGTSILPISQKKDSVPQMVFNVKEDSLMVISGRIYFINTDGVIRHCDLIGRDIHDLIPNVTGCLPISASSFASHGDRLLFTGFVTDSDNIVHSYPLIKYLEVRDQSHDPISGNLFFLGNPHRTYHAQLKSSLGPAKIYAEIRGKHADSFHILGESNWDSWKTGVSRLLNVEYQPQSHGYHEAELVFVDATTNGVLSTNYLAGQTDYGEGVLRFTHENGSHYPLANEPIRVQVNPSVYQKGQISKVMVYEYQIVNDTYELVLIAESSDQSFLIPPKDAGRAFVKIVALDAQGRVIMQQDREIFMSTPYRADNEARIFEGLLGQGTSQINQSGHFLLQQNSDQTYSYRIKLGATTWRGKGRFDSLGVTEIRLKKSLTHKAIRIYLQKMLGEYSQKPSLVSARITDESWLANAEGYEFIWLPVHYRENTATIFPEIQGKKYAFNLDMSWVPSSPTELKKFSEHSGYYLAFLDYGFDDHVALTLHHVNQRFFQSRLYPLSDGSLIFYHEQGGISTSLQLIDNFGYLKHYKTAGKKLAYYHNLWTSREIPALPPTEPFFVPREDHEILQVGLYSSVKQDHLYFNQIPQLASANLTNELGQAVQYVIREDGMVTGMVRWSDKVLPFSGYYYPANLENDDHGEIRGVVHQNGKWFRDIEIKLQN